MISFAVHNNPKLQVFYTLKMVPEKLGVSKNCIAIWSSVDLKLGPFELSPCFLIQVSCSDHHPVHRLSVEIRGVGMHFVCLEEADSR